MCARRDLEVIESKICIVFIIWQNRGLIKVCVILMAKRCIVTMKVFEIIIYSKRENERERETEEIMG